MNSFSDNKKEKGFSGRLTEDVEYTRMFNQGSEYYDKDQYEEARTSFEEMILRFPDRVGGFLFLGMTYSQLDLYDESEQTLRKAIELSPDDAFIWVQLGYTLYMQYNKAEAEEAYRRALQLDSEYVGALLGLCDVLQDTDRAKEARVLLLRGIELEPDNYWLWQDLGRAYYELDDYDKAMNAFTRAAILRKDTSKPYRGIALVHEAQGELDLALQAYDTALEIEPEDRYALRGRARILVTDGAYEESEDILKQLTSEDQTDCESLALLGHVYLNTDRIGLAEEAFFDALEECKNEELAHRGLLTIYERTGRVVEAEELRERLRKMVDGEEVTDEVMDNIIQSIDPSIQRIIAEFHQLGLMTSSCCSGLPEDHPNGTRHNPYVYFMGDYEGSHHHLFTIANMAGWKADPSLRG